MKKIIMKYRKSFIASSVLILMLMIVPLYITIKDNFDQMVDISLKYFLADISHTTSDLSTFGLIEIDDAVLKDDKGVTILYAPKLILRYSIKDLLKGKITEISAENPYIYIAVNKNRGINIVDIFTNRNSEKTKNSKRSKSSKNSKKAGIGISIDIITVTNGRLLFQDNYYENPINKFVDNIDGYVSFDDTRGIDLNFYNTKGNEMVNYSFTNYEKEYSMTIKLKNENIDQDLMQYAYVGKYTNYLGGKADLDLTIDSDGLWGDAYLSKASFHTSAYDGIATDIHGRVDFLGKRIKLKLDGEMEGKDVDFSLKYTRDNIEMNIIASDLNKEEIKKVTLLDDTLKKKIDDLGDFNISYLRLNFNFDKEFNLTLDNYLRLNTLNIKDTKIKDLKGSIVFSKDQIELKDLRFFLKYDGNEGYTILNGSYEKDILNLNFSVLNKKSPLKLKKLNGNFKYDLNTENIDYTLYSDILKIDGNVDLNKKTFGISSIGTKDVEIKYKDEYYSTKNDVKVIYDYANKNLILGEGDVEIKEKNSPRTLALNFTNNGNRIYFNKVDLFYNELQLSANGYLNIDKLTYNFNYIGKNLKVENFVSIDDLKTGIDFEGTFIGKKQNFSLVSNLESKGGKYGVSYKDVRGRLKVINDSKTGKVGVDFDGYLGEVSYDGIEFKDFKVGLNYCNGVFKVLEARNNLLTIVGDYNIISQTLDFDYKIRGVKENKIKLLEKYGIKMDLENVDGSLKGELKDLKIKLYSANAWVQYKNLPKIYLKGGIHFYNQKIFLDEFKVDENNISGYYDIYSKKFRLKVNLLENNLAEYYGDVNLKYRLTGEVVLWGTPDNISGVFKTFTDNVYLRGRKLPNIKMISTYKGGNLNRLNKSGHMDINSITIYSGKGDKLLNGGGWIDLNQNKISFKINDVLDVEKLKEYSETQDLSGKLKTKISIDGSFDDLKYNLNIDSKVIFIDGNKFENLKTSFQGNLKKLILKELSLNYHGNKLTSQGKIDFKNFDYSLNIKSNEIDLSFLNIFSFSEYINQIKGIATIDVEINSKNNYGKFKIKNFSAEMPKYGFFIDKVNTQMILNKKLLKIDYFKGKVNNGDIKMEGYLKIPAFDGIENQVSKLDYRLNLILDNIDYSYHNKINLVLSSDAIFTKNKVTGDFVINSGEILEIPDFKDIEVSNIASQIKERDVIKGSRELGRDFEIKIIEDDSPSIDIDINLKTEDSIELKISKLTYTSIIKNIHGNLNIDGNLKLKNKEISYNGMLSIDDGSIVLNNNLFYLSTATAKFIKTETESVSFNPIVILNANSTIANEDIYININGEYPNLQIQMSTGSGLNEDDIGSLLTFHNISDKKNTNVIMKDVLDSEISDKLFSPISSEIASVLKIEKFQISSDLVAYEYEGGIYKDTGTLGLGASIYAENPIYKDKLYWKAKARWGASKYYDNVTEYDFALDYRITKYLSWGGGVGKIPEGRARTGNTLVNYHIDLSWRKKYKNLEQIILNIFLLGGK